MGQAQHGRFCMCIECVALFSVPHPMHVMHCDREGCAAEAPAYSGAEGWRTDLGMHFCPEHAKGPVR